MSRPCFDFQHSSSLDDPARGGGQTAVERDAADDEEDEAGERHAEVDNHQRTP